MAETFAAVTVFAGRELLHPYNPSRFVPFAFIHGSSDNVVDPERALEAFETIKAYNFATVETNLADYQIYRPITGTTGADVLHYYIQGMEHIEWPSPLSNIPFPAPIDGNKVMFEFFASHPL